MKVKFYGTRGSILVPGERFTRYGGNTTCVLVTGVAGHFVVLDAGSGIRVLGEELVANGGIDRPIPILLSHTHWDHIQGFPFFKPAFDPRQSLRVVIHEREKDHRTLQGIFAGQMDDQYFPVPLQAMGADITFDEPDLSDFAGPGGARIQAALHSHPGGAYG